MSSEPLEGHRHLHVRFSADGPTGRGPVGIQTNPLRVSAGTPLPLTVWVTDDSVREEDPVVIKQRLSLPTMNVTWFKYLGPGPSSSANRKSPNIRNDSL